jgi:hypothetical protein
MSPPSSGFNEQGSKNLAWSRQQICRAAGTTEYSHRVPTLMRATEEQHLLLLQWYTAYNPYGHEWNWKSAGFKNDALTLHCSVQMREEIPCFHKPEYAWRMPSSVMLRRVALVGTDVSEEPSARCEEIFLCSVLRLLVTAYVVPSSPILVILIMKTLGSSETSVLTRVTRRNIPEDGILHSHRRENLKSYRMRMFTVCSLIQFSVISFIRNVRISLM